MVQEGAEANSCWGFMQQHCEEDEEAQASLGIRGSTHYAELVQSKYKIRRLPMQVHLQWSGELIQL